MSPETRGNCPARLMHRTSRCAARNHEPRRCIMSKKKTNKATADQPAVIPVKAKTPKKAKAKEAKPTKLSALDAAAKVLADAGTPMNCQGLIAAMAAKKLWISPGGKTPHATLFSAILREINTKGKDA